jgi:hypothetical protein
MLGVDAGFVGAAAMAAFKRNPAEGIPVHEQPTAWASSSVRRTAARRR